MIPQHIEFTPEEDAALDEGFAEDYAAAAAHEQRKAKRRAQYAARKARAQAATADAPRTQAQGPSA